MRPEAVDPATAALAVKGALGLVKVFAALWTPIIAQILQMSSSRQREGHADEAGATLTEDAESLGLALGMLMTWRPPQASFDRLQLPFLAAAAHLFTVNPVRQMQEAGALEASPAAPAQRVHDLSDLFITHPDTTKRIERLYDMSQSQRRDPPAGGGSAGSQGRVAPEDPTRSAMASEPADGRTEAVDGDTDEGLTVPGLDARLAPVIEVLKSEIESSPEKYRKLGHLLWALVELVNRGGMVRYTGLALDGRLLASHYDPSAKALYLNAMFRRGNPKVQAAVLAAQLQALYDHLNDRSAGTQEAMVRNVMALDAFLEGTDMGQMAAGLDINNPVEIQLFETVVQQRLWAATGLGAMEQVFKDHLTVPQILAKGQDQMALLERNLRDLKDQLQLVEEGLRGGPDAALEKEARVLREKTAILEGNILVGKAQLSMAQKEQLNNRQGGRNSLDTPLSVDERRSRIDLAKLRQVPVKEKANVDPKLAEAVALLRDTIATSKDPDTRGLTSVVAALDKLLARGGRVLLAPSGTGAAAYFSPVTLDLVVGQQFANTHPALVAAIMTHELTHADDYFEGRPMTRETEKNAFTNEAIFAGNFDPKAIAAKLDVRNPMEQSAYQLIYHARTRYVEGNTSLDAMISQAYTSLFGAHFEGLQTAAQLLAEIKTRKLNALKEHLAQLEQRAALVKRAADANRDPMRLAQYDQMQRAIVLQAATVALLERQAAQLEGLAKPDKDAPEPATPPAAGPSASSGPTIGAQAVPTKKPGRQAPLGLPGSFFGPKLGLLPPGHAPPGSFSLQESADPFHPLSPSSYRPDRARAPDPEPPGGPRPGGRGLFRGAWDRFAGLFRVLPEKDRNREFWKFTLGQALLTIGVSFHYTALPGLVAPAKADAAKLGYNRAVNWGSQALSSLATGPMVDRNSTTAVLGWTLLGRAILLFSVPLLFSAFGTGAVFAGLFLGVVFLTGFLQSTGITAGSVAFARILGKEEAYYNKANAVANVVLNVVGVFAPLLAGAFIGIVDQRYGVLHGNAFAYGVYAAVAGLVALLYGRFMRVPRDEVMQARRDLDDLLRRGAGRNPRVKGVSSATDGGDPLLLVEVTGDPADVQGVPARFADYEVRVVAKRSQARELIQGFRILLKNRFLRLAMLFSTLELLAADSLVFTALPRYIQDVLGTANSTVSALASTPGIGPMIVGLTSKAGAFGLYLAAASLGLGLSSLVIMLLRDRSASDLEARLRAFRAELADGERGLGDDALEAAVSAARGSVETVLAGYRQRWRQDPSYEPGTAAFRQDLDAAAAAALNRDVFEGKRDAAAMRALMAETGLSAALAAWAERFSTKVLRDARKEARSGLDPLQRAGRLSSILFGLGALAYWGVFFSHGLWASVGWMLLSAALQGPASIIWSSLYQKVLMKDSPHDMGKVFSSMNFYQLMLSIVGVLFFGWLMTALPTVAALWIVGGVMTVVALAAIVEPFVLFPLDRR